MKVREKYLKSKFNHYIALDDIMKFKPPMRMNTILIKELYNYAITQDGFILNKKNHEVDRRIL